MTAATVEQLLLAARGPPVRLELASALGLRALDEGREEEALPFVAAALARAPHDARLLHIVGLLYRATGDPAAGVPLFDRALALAPDDARLVHARARTAFEAGLPCLEWYHRARQLAPSDADIIIGYAAALSANGEATRADTLLATTLRQHPGWLAGHATLIRLRYAARRRDDWLAELDTALCGAPNDPRLHHLRVMALHRAGLGADALAATARALAIPGEFAAVKSAAAIVATEHGTIRDADAAFAGLDPLAEPDLTVHWLRHLLRRQEPHRVSALAGKMPAAAAGSAWPYLSLAWRLLGDARAAWLDDRRLIKVVDLVDDDTWLAPLADTLRALHTTHGQPLEQSVRGGTQTDGPLFSRFEPVIRHLRGRVAGAVADYISGLPPRDASHPLLGHIPKHPRFTGSWSVRLKDGGFHVPHIHGEGWISSAFYVRLPKCTGDTDAGRLTLGEPQASLGVNLPPYDVIEPRPGRLVLFPSTMWHGTRPFPEGERLTVAFDIA